MPKQYRSRPPKENNTVQFRQNAKVISAAGQEIGRISRVVINPLGREVTHLVIEEQGVPAREKLVSLDLIARSSEEQAVLIDEVSSEELPPYQETHYVPLTKKEAERANIPDIHARPVYFYPPLGEAWQGEPYPPDFPEQPYVAKTERNLPEERVPLQKGSRVVSLEGEHLGEVEQLFTDPETGQVTHVLISEGAFLNEQKLVPAPWVGTIGEDQVELKVSSDLLDGLPSYQETKEK